MPRRETANRNSFTNMQQFKNYFEFLDSIPTRMGHGLRSGVIDKPPRFSACKYFYRLWGAEGCGLLMAVTGDMQSYLFSFEPVTSSPRMCTHPLAFRTHRVDYLNRNADDPSNIYVVLVPHDVTAVGRTTILTAIQATHLTFMSFLLYFLYVLHVLPVLTHFLDLNMNIFQLGVRVPDVYQVFKRKQCLDIFVYIFLRLNWALFVFEYFTSYRLEQIVYTTKHSKKLHDMEHRFSNKHILEKTPKYLQMLHKTAPGLQKKWWRSVISKKNLFGNQDYAQNCAKGKQRSENSNGVNKIWLV